jgi:hypothetical protein
MRWCQIKLQGKRWCKPGLFLCSAPVPLKHKTPFSRAPTSSNFYDVRIVYALFKGTLFLKRSCEQCIRASIITGYKLAKY